MSDKGEGAPTTTIQAKTIEFGMYFALFILWALIFAADLCKYEVVISILYTLVNQYKQKDFSEVLPMYFALKNHNTLRFSSLRINEF